MAPALLSRALDPILGVFTGVLAYYLYETNPRTALPPHKTLSQLATWKWDKWKREREERLQTLEAAEWQAVVPDSSKTKS